MSSEKPSQYLLNKLTSRNETIIGIIYVIITYKWIFIVNRNFKNIFIPSVITSLLFTIPVISFASDFSLPFYNVAGLGDAYADWATAASDASTEYSNPAGLVKITRQQLVFAPMGILGSTKFTGTTITPSFPFPFTIVQSGSASSRISAFLPSLYYSIPIDDRFVFGFGITSPFALGTKYADNSLVRYTSTRSQVVAVDVGPSIGAKITDKVSVGLGLDAVHLAFTLNNMYGPPISIPDAEVQNHLSGWGYGYHAGVLYQPLPATRVGLSFNSMVMIHTTGDSEVYPPFPQNIEFRTNNQKTNAALPARAQLSLQQDINCRWTVMATAFYTNWETFDKITMKRVILPGGSTTSVSIPFNYHNTFDYSFGTSYKATDQWLLRVGMQFMNTPTNNRDRAIADPIGSAFVLGVGARYQQNLCLSYDIAYGHSFFKKEPVNLANQLTIDIGHNKTQTSVFGAQVNWNI